KNADIIYDDVPGKMFASLKGFDMNATGDFATDDYTPKTNAAIAQLNFKEGGTSYLKNAVVGLEADVNVKGDTYTFGKNELSLNALALQFEGMLKMLPDDVYDMDLKFASKKAEFKSILSLVPAIYLKDFEKVKTDGNLALSGFAKGKFEGENYPAFGLDVKVDNASFQYPDLPTAMKNIFIDLKIKSPGGDLDKMEIALS